MLYRLLATRNEHHDQDLVKKLRLLYEGGYAVRKNATLFLARSPQEGKEYYEYRCRQTAYMPYLGQLVDYLVGALFQNDLQVLPAGDGDDPSTPGDLPDETFYPDFSANADRKKTTFAQVIRDCVTEALIAHCAWVAVDMPPAVQADSRAEEEAKGGGRAYCCAIPFDQIYDWREDDDDDEFTWVILGKRIQERKTPEDARDTYVDRFTVWTKTPAGQIEYCCYETEPIKVGTEPKGDYDVPEVERATTSFKKIPIERMELPAGLWAGNKIGPMSEEHFSRRSELIGSMARSLVEIPFVKLGPEIPPVGGDISTAQENPNRGLDPIGQAKQKGFMTLGAQDEVGFAGPSGRAYDVTDTQLKDLRDEIFRSVHAMAANIANSAAATGRSGESKAEDRSATEIVLDYIGDLACKFAVRIYATVSAARGEDVKWVAHGLDSFDLDDRTELITEAGLLEPLALPSATWRKEYQTHLALSTVPGCSPETKAIIQREIADGIDEKVELDAATTAANAAAARDAAKPPTGGAADPLGAQKSGVPGAPPTASSGPPVPGKPGAKPPAGAKPSTTTPKGAFPPPAGKPGGKAPPPAATDPAGPIHTRTATSSGVAETVYNQLAEDFPEDKLGWVRAAVWEGPLDIPLDSIDTSNSDTWAAASEQDRVSYFDGEIADGTVKPVVLVNEPNQNKLIVVDGHHRVMAAMEAKSSTIPAFVAHVTSVGGPWTELHASQKKNDSGPQ